MKKVLVIGLFVALAMAGCKLPGQKASFNADDQAFCMTNYTTEDACSTNEKCEWKLRSDGKEVCRAKRM